MDSLHTEKDKKQHASTFHAHDCHLLLKIIGLTRLTCYYTPQETEDHYTIWRRISELYWVNQKLDGYPIILRKLHSERIFPCGKTVLVQLNETDLRIIHPGQVVLIGLPMMEGIICKDSSSYAQIK